MRQETGAKQSQAEKAMNRLSMLAPMAITKIALHIWSVSRPPCFITSKHMVRFTGVIRMVMDAPTAPATKSWLIGTRAIMPWRMQRIEGASARAR